MDLVAPNALRSTPVFVGAFSAGRLSMVGVSQVTNESIALIGVRILGLFFLGQGILELSNLYFIIDVLPSSDLPYGIKAEQAVVLSSTVCLPWLVGAGLLVWNRRLARWIVPNATGPSKPADAPDMSQLHAVAFSLLGLLMVWMTIPNFLGAWADYYNQMFVQRVDKVSGYVVVSLVSYSLIVAIGVALFVGRGFFVRLFQKFREFGLH